MAIIKGRLAGDLNPDFLGACALFKRPVTSAAQHFLAKLT
jgi:hypothetical protein